MFYPSIFAHAFSSWFSFSVAMMSQLLVHTDSFYINWRKKKSLDKNYFTDLITFVFFS